MTSTTPTTIDAAAARAAYLELFPRPVDAVAFEDAILTACDPAHLPEAARDVLRGGDGTPDYFAWLCAQYDLVMREANH